MGVGFWTVVLAAGVGGYFAFRGLRSMETEIREEIARKEAADSAGAPPVVKTAPAPPQPTVDPAPAVTLEDQILSRIRARPGQLQTELYRELSQVNRKELQELLLRLDRAGRLRRVKEKSTYKLYPA